MGRHIAHQNVKEAGKGVSYLVWRLQDSEARARVCSFATEGREGV